MLIQILGLSLLAFLGGCIVYLVGLIAWIVLKLLKEMLHLPLKFDLGKKDDKDS
jgi:hypothetical protein